MRRSPRIAVALGALGLVATVLAACEPAPPPPGPRCQQVGHTAHLDQRYASTPGTPARLQSLDVYQPKLDRGCAPTPVVIWVHGGGWRTGDKGNQMLAKVDLFARQQGWLLISTNYRLSPNPIDLTSPTAVRAPTHAQDVAAAIAWARANAARFGGDPDRIALVGHSAGAHLVSQVGTDESLLAGASVPRSSLRCVVSLDTSAYDVTEVAPGSPLHQNAFGTDPAGWRASSPLHQVTAGEALPRFHLVVQDRPQSRARTERFRDALRSAGGAATSTAVPLSHEEINAALGQPSDRLVTPGVMLVLGTCLR
jgi:acetyl esterase/lipase